MSTTQLSRQRGLSLTVAIAVLVLVGFGILAAMRFANSMWERERYDALITLGAAELELFVRCAGSHVTEEAATMAENTRISYSTTSLPCLDNSFARHANLPAGSTPFGRNYRAHAIKDGDGHVRVVITEIGTLRPARLDALGKPYSNSSEQAATSSSIAGDFARAAAKRGMVSGVIEAGTRSMRGVSAGFTESLNQWLTSADTQDRVVAFWGWPEYNADNDRIPVVDDPIPGSEYARCRLYEADPVVWPEPGGISWNTGGTMAAANGSCPAGWDAVYTYRACNHPNEVVLTDSGDRMVFGTGTRGSGAPGEAGREIFSTIGLPNQLLSEFKCTEDGYNPGPIAPFCFSAWCPYTTSVNPNATSSWCCEPR